jgi:RNA polymerase subunit RPABC4/transcription elongation factor Spt4
MTICPQCHTIHGEEHNFCQRCGNPLVEEDRVSSRPCSNCGAPIYPGQNYCLECGQRVKTSARAGGRPLADEDLFYRAPSPRSRVRPAPRRGGVAKWVAGIVGLAILVGVFFLWPKAPERKPTVPLPGLPPSAPSGTEKVDTLARDVERLAERIRAAHMKKDMNLFISCYAPSYPNLGELERQTYENWKNFDFKNVSYNIANLRRIGPNQAVAEFIWNFQLINNQTKASEMHRAVVNVTLEEIGGVWKIRESKDMG